MAIRQLRYGSVTSTDSAFFSDTHSERVDGGGHGASLLDRWSHGEWNSCPSPLQLGSRVFMMSGIRPNPYLLAAPQRRFQPMFGGPGQFNRQLDKHGEEQKCVRLMQNARASIPSEKR